MCQSGDDAAKMDVNCCVVFNRRCFECRWQQALASFFFKKLPLALLLYFLLLLLLLLSTTFTHPTNNRILASYVSFSSDTHDKKCRFVVAFFSSFFSIRAFQFSSVASLTSQRTGRNALSHLFGSLMLLCQSRLLLRLKSYVTRV